MYLLTRTIPFGVLFLSALVLMGANPFRGETIAPTDLLVRQPGWKSTNISLPLVHSARSDVLDYKIPSWMALKSRIRAGELPLWIDTTAGGVPGIQLVSRSAVTPAFLAFALAPNDALGFYLSNLINLLIGGLGMYLFLKSLSLDTSSSLFGALVFAFSGFHAAWFYWHHVNTSIWIPWLLFCVSAFNRSGRLVYLSGVATSSAMMLLGGYPAVALYGFIAGGVLAGVLLMTRSQLGKDTVISGGFLLIATCSGLALSWFAITPLFEQLEHTAVGYRSGGSPMRRSDIAQFWNPFSGGNKPGKVLHFGIPALLLSLAGLALIPFLRSRAGALFAALLGLISVTIVFTLLPPEWIRKIPGFQLANNWNRMSILLVISAAVLSATALNHLQGLLSHWPRISLTVAITLTSAQFANQKILFDQFNSAVPGDSFMPSTPSINLVKTELGPLQSVIAESRAYLPSGTLGSYDIPEWFAHDFKSPTEKQALSHVLHAAFRTPTASTPHCWNVIDDARLLALYGIRYLLCLASKPPKPSKSSPPKKTVPSRSLSQFRLDYYFVVPNALKINQVALSITTHGRKDLGGTLELLVQSNEGVIARKRIDASNVSGRKWARFRFDEPIALGQGAHRLSLEWLNPSRNGKLSVLMKPVPSGSPNHVVDYFQSDQLVTSTGYDFVMLINDRPFEAHRSVQAPSLPSEGFKKINVEPKISVIENQMTGATGAYLLDALTDTATLRFDDLELQSYRSGKIAIDYTGSAPRWLILPMRSYPGWLAKVNGTVTEPERFLDLMPAIRLEGPSRVTFDYRPVKFFQAIQISASAWIVLIGLTLFFWRREKATEASASTKNPEF